MNKTLVTAVALLFLFLPALSFSDIHINAGSNSGHNGTTFNYVNNFGDDFTGVDKIISINFKSIKSDPILLSQDKDTFKMPRTNIFNSQTKTAVLFHDTPEPLLGNLSINPYFGDPEKSFKSAVFDFPSTFGQIMATGTAFLANLAAHEFGHALVGEYVGATGNTVSFFDKRGGQFFLGMSSVTGIKAESKLPYTMGGEFFADITFEHALQSYRSNPNVFNKYLMLFSGTDFLWYCSYAFYLTDGHSNFDPVTIVKETGLSKDELFSIVLAKTMINAYRIYSGQDRVIPYFTVDSSSAALNLSVPF